MGAYGRVTKIGGINVPSTDFTVKLDSGVHGFFTEDQLVKAEDE